MFLLDKYLRYSFWNFYFVLCGKVQAFAKSEKYISSQEGDMTVVLDIELTEELIEEGFVRELISKIQNLRKESGFEVQNHIEMYYSDNKRLAEIIERNKEQIADETLADLVTEGEGTTMLDINGEKLNVKLVVVK